MPAAANMQATVRSIGNRRRYEQSGGAYEQSTGIINPEFDRFAARRFTRSKQPYPQLRRALPLRAHQECVRPEGRLRCLADGSDLADGMRLYFGAG
ncbi:hypothetical protein PACILC2_50330 [Paenibacillus cisolokensis]|uniref:Uncharacterized protein n=1 Tax=Paenibacillus cisolokensis TaxID=1658519 RepID=A0ABQ4NE07_9BACL|nr:hypothetical protein PACILC2_50330 [Paenibacillus cisolokensis]